MTRDFGFYCWLCFSALPWTTGFWFWDSSYREPAWTASPADVIFAHAGTILKINKPAAGQPDWYVTPGDLPFNVPPAKEYWLVFRYETQGVPVDSIAPQFGAKVSEALKDARQRNLKVAGVQLDVDSPTSALADYAGMREPAFKVWAGEFQPWLDRFLR